jgi:hypothetical protein
MRARTRTLGTTLATLALAAIAGCGGSSGDDDVREVALVDLPCATLDPTTGIWETAPFPSVAACGAIDAGVGACCPWIELPGHTIVQIEHPLARIPRVVDPWISFSEFGVGSTVGSGDSLRLRTADDTYVVVENNTDQRFYLRIDLR